AIAVSCSARSAETRDPNTVVCGWIAEPDSFAPLTQVNTSAGRMIDDLLYTPLIDTAPNLLPRFSTSLAERVVIDDGGRRYRLFLRKNARWSDGPAVTAEDVVFSIKAGNNRSVIESNASDFTLMRSIRAVDRFTVEVRLSRPSPPFLTNALGETYALPAHLLRKYPEESAQEAQYLNTNSDFAQHPVGYGAFRIKRHVRDSYLILEPNPTYWGARPPLNQVAFRVYPQQDSLYAAVDAGEVDVTDIPPNLWRVHARLRGNHRTVTWPWNVAFVLLPNYHDRSAPYLTDRSVRQAMLLAINRDFITRGIMSGQADLLNGPVPSFSPYYDPHLPRYPYDPRRAGKTLEAAGWRLRGNLRVKNGVVLRVTLKTGGATDAVAGNIAELIQANLRAVGIDCELQNEEIRTFFEDLHHSRFSLALRGVILPAYPDDYKQYDSKQTRENGGYNIGYYNNPQVDRAIEDARSASSVSAARSALRRYQELAAEDLPALYLYSNRLGAVVPSNLRGYELTPLAAAALPTGVQFWHLIPSSATRR
ncbi:MAG: peptide ABC transporter substrate-binding protein, partial [Candidatus Eremiobacteraeota bacterium]|nr:peptide ABC transporter substrate-binding protein [Candidatus Eremiobacteraeota bacterium]